MAKGNGHAWGKEAAGWVRCTRCWVPVKPGREKKAPPCKGEPQLALKVHPSLQATLFVAEGEPLVACLACGSYGSFKAYNLAGCCKPEEAKVKYGRRRALQRMARGTHPGNDKKGVAIDPMDDAPELPQAWQLEVSPPQPQLRMLRLSRKVCMGCAPRPPPAWAVPAERPRFRCRYKQPGPRRPPPRGPSVAVC